MNYIGKAVLMYRHQIFQRPGEQCIFGYLEPTINYTKTPGKKELTSKNIQFDLMSA